MKFNQKKLFRKFGEVINYHFFESESGFVYLKIPEVTVVVGGNNFNAIDIEDDCFDFFDNDDKVKLLDYELTIKEWN